MALGQAGHAGADHDRIKARDVAVLAFCCRLPRIRHGSLPPFKSWLPPDGSFRAAPATSAFYSTSPQLLSKCKARRLLSTHQKYRFASSAILMLMTLLSD